MKGSNGSNEFNTSREISRMEIVQQIIDLKGGRIGADFRIGNLTQKELDQLEHLESKLKEIDKNDHEIFSNALQRIQKNNTPIVCGSFLMMLGRTNY